MAWAFFRAAQQRQEGRVAASRGLAAKHAAKNQGALRTGPPFAPQSKDLPALFHGQWRGNANARRKTPRPMRRTGRFLSRQEGRIFVGGFGFLLQWREGKGGQRRFPRRFGTWLRRSVAFPGRTVLRLGRGRRQRGEGRLRFFRRRRWTDEGPNPVKERAYSLAVSASSSKGGKGKAGKDVSSVGSGFGSAVP